MALERNVPELTFTLDAFSFLRILKSFHERLDEIDWKFRQRAKEHAIRLVSCPIIN